MPTRAVPKTFTAPLERMGGNLAWTIIWVPFDVARVWGVRGQLRVRGEVNGFPFRSALFPDGRGRHFLMVNKEMQKGAGARAGMQAKFRMEPDPEKREIAEPAELARVLKQSRALAKFYRELSESLRRDIAKWVGAPKGEAARKRRAEQFAERVLQTLEAERELPPAVRRIFDQTPRAWQAWQGLTPKQRRRELLGIFYYRDPESQARRVRKALEMAVGKL